MEAYIPSMTVLGILGALTPLAATAINRLTWSDQRKQLVAVAAAVVISVFTMWALGVLESGVPLPILILAFVGISDLAYSFVWKPTGVIATVQKKTATTQAEKKIIAAEDADPPPPQDYSVGDKTPSQIIAEDAMARETDTTPPPSGYKPQHRDDGY